MATLHAVFTREPLQRHSSWLTWDAAQEAFSKFEGDNYVVRSSADPNFANAPVVVTEATYVKLTRDDREWLLITGRRAGSLEAAKDAMLDELLADPRFSHLPVEEVSDYAWAAAKFCFPTEWKESWA